MKRWLLSISGMKAADKNRLTIIAIAVMAGLFVPLFYLRSHADLSFAEEMVARRADRIRRRHVDVQPPAVSAAVIERDITRIKGEIASIQAELADFRARFTPAAGDDQQSVKLEISQLAQQSGVAVDSLVFDPPEHSAQIGRPLVSLQAHGSFQAMQRLFRGLPDLSRSVTVVRFSMEAAAVKPPPGQNVSPLDAGGVRVDLQLAI